MNEVDVGRTLLLFFWAFGLAAIEIEIEGSRGWAERLPTWYLKRGPVGRGYGGPMLCFLVQYLGVVIESVRPFRRLLQRRPWLGRLWAMSIVVLPLGLFAPVGLVDDCLVPLLVAFKVPNLTP